MSPASSAEQLAGFGPVVFESEEFSGGPSDLQAVHVPRGARSGTQPRAPSGSWSWVLPGQGVPCGRSAHRPFRYRACPGNHAVPFVDSCDSRACPTCWREGWMRREAGHIGTVLRAEADARRATGAHAAVIHVSVNPPPSLWGLADEGTPRNPNQGYRRLRARAYRVARKAGVEGGAAIFHRVRCADRTDPVETDGPHFHILGFGWVADGSVTFKRTGWVVKNHGVRRGMRAVVGTATYVLSHSHRAELDGPAPETAGVARGGNSQEGKSGGLTLTVTWFGRTVRASEIKSEGAFCPLCERCWPKSEWLDLEWVGQGPPPSAPVSIDWSLWRAYAVDRVGHLGHADRISVERGPR